MAIFELRSGWTEQITTVHAVHCIDDTMEAGSKIADVPHPLEHPVDVDVTGAETKNGVQNGQNRTDEYGKLQ